MKEENWGKAVSKDHSISLSQTVSFPSHLPPPPPPPPSSATYFVVHQESNVFGRHVGVEGVQALAKARIRDAPFACIKHTRM
jgi:hypothetical protein